MVNTTTIHPWTDSSSSVAHSFVESLTNLVESISNTLNHTNITMSASTNSVDTFNGDVPYEDYKYRPETYIVPIIFGIIFFAGLTGNGMLIAVFVKHRAMRNVPNT